jgi:hypothetical protein
MSSKFCFDANDLCGAQSHFLQSAVDISRKTWCVDGVIKVKVWLEDSIGGRKSYFLSPP